MVESFVEYQRKLEDAASTIVLKTYGGNNVHFEATPLEKLRHIMQHPANEEQTVALIEKLEAGQITDAVYYESVRNMIDVFVKRIVLKKLKEKK